MPPSREKQRGWTNALMWQILNRRKTQVTLKTSIFAFDRGQNLEKLHQYNGFFNVCLQFSVKI